MKFLTTAVFLFLAVLTGTAGNAAAGTLRIADGTGGMNLNALAFAAAAISGEGSEITIRKMSAAEALRLLREKQVEMAIVARKDIPGSYSGTAIYPYAQAALFFSVAAGLGNPLRSLTLAELQQLWSAPRPVWKHNGIDIQRIAVCNPMLEKRFFQPAKEIYRPAGHKSYIPNTAMLCCSDEPYMTNSRNFVKIDGVYPSPENIRNRTYPLTVDFVLVTIGKPVPLAAQLIAALRHRKVRQLLRDAGFFPPPLQERK